MDVEDGVHAVFEQLLRRGAAAAIGGGIVGQMGAVVIIDGDALILQAFFEAFRHVVYAAPGREAAVAVGGLVAFVAVGAIQRHRPLARGYRLAVVLQPGHVRQAVGALALRHGGMGRGVHPGDHIMLIVVGDIFVSRLGLPVILGDFVSLPIQDAIYLLLRLRRNGPIRR